MMIYACGSPTGKGELFIFKIMASLHDIADHNNSNPQDIVSVVNMSFGSQLDPGSGSPRPWRNTLAEYERWFNANPNTLFVASAGNNNADARLHIPSMLTTKCNNVISVAATTQGRIWDLWGHIEHWIQNFFGLFEDYPVDQRADFSNYGPAIDIAAPGNYVWTTSPLGPDGKLGTNDDSVGYGPFGGTSASAPLVAGVAGLMESINPNLTPSDLKTMIHDTGDDITTDKPISGKRLNALNAVQAAIFSQLSPQLRSPARDKPDVDPFNVTFEWEPLEHPGGHEVQYCVTIKEHSSPDDIPVFTGCDSSEFSPGTTLFFTDTILEPGKTYYWAVWAKDDQGNWSEASEWWSFSTAFSVHVGSFVFPIDGMPGDSFCPSDTNEAPRQDNMPRSWYSVVWSGRYEGSWENRCKGTGGHTGVDIRVPSGTQVRAVGVGTVYASYDSPTWGGLIVIRHDNIPGTGETIWSIYAHLKARAVQQDEEIPYVGYPIGLSGGALSDPNHGASTGSHLHFQIDRGDDFSAPYWPVSGTEAFDPNLAENTYDPIAFIEFHQVDLNDGLVAYYPFNGNADDESGNGNNGTVYGATLTSDRFGNSNSAYSFDGVDDYIEGSNPNITTDSSFTVSFWMKYEWTPHRIWILYFGYHDQYQCVDPDGFHMLFNINNEWGLERGDTQFGFFCGTQNQFNIADLQGEWIHVTTVYDKEYKEVKSYINGSLADIDHFQTLPSTGDYPLYIAKVSQVYGGDSYFKGIVDEIRIYNRAISEAEIQQLFEDSDGDGIYDDGDGSGTAGDNPCTGGETENCDDNCPDTYNPDQADSDADGIGDACDEVFGVVILQPGPGEGKDIWTTSVYSYAPGGGGPGGGLDNEELRVGGWADTYLALLEFDLTGLPQYATSAVLELYECNSHGGTSVPMYLDRITEPWDWDRNDRLWWADRPSTVQWSPSTLPAPTVNAWYSVDITELYNGWQDGTYPNYGLQLRPTATNNRWNFFYSSDYIDDPALRPKLVVTP